MKKLIVAALMGITITTKAMTFTDNLIVWAAQEGTLDRAAIQRLGILGALT